MQGKRQHSRVAGIIAEYNPFHNGHLYHLQEAVKRTESDFVVAVMSGNFLQRGEPAIYDKWVRAEAAIKNGVDIVLELPFAFACNSAEYFAYGAVRLLEGLGCITHLAFGSECASLEKLQTVAAILASEEDRFKAGLKKHLDRGLSYPKARHEALREEVKTANQDREDHASLAECKDAADDASLAQSTNLEDIIRQPNNILAVEYLKQIIRQNSSMQPVVIPRYKTGYKDRIFHGDMASATAIRETIAEKFTGGDRQKTEWDDCREKIKDVVPKETYNIFVREGPEKIVMADMLFRMLQYKIIATPHEEAAKIFGVGEGLEHKMAKEIRGAHCYRGLVKAVLSKRYTQTRIQRGMIHLLMNFTKSDMDKILENIDDCLYGRLLAFSQKGRALIAQIKKEKIGQYPIYTNINRQIKRQSQQNLLLRYDVLAADIYHMMAGSDIYLQSDFVKKPYIANI